MAYPSSAALDLALTQNEPCPVCGGLEHPNKAQYSGDVVRKVQVEQARQQQQDWEQRRQRHSILGCNKGLKPSRSRKISRLYRVS